MAWAYMWPADIADGPLEIRNLATSVFLERRDNRITHRYGTVFGGGILFDGEGAAAAMRNLARVLGAYEYNSTAFAGRVVARVVAGAATASINYDWFFYRETPGRSTLTNLTLVTSIERTRNLNDAALFDVCVSPGVNYLATDLTAAQCEAIFTSLAEITGAVRASGLAT